MSDRRTWVLASVAWLAGCGQIPKARVGGAPTPSAERRAATGVASEPEPGNDPIGDIAGATPAARLSVELSRQVTFHAMTLVGTPYRRGGNTPETGFDCSGLIAYVYRQEAQLAAPRTVATLQFWGHPVEAWQARAGDLVLFSSQRQSEPTHAGIFVGAGRFVHAPSAGGTVRLDAIQGPHWGRQVALYRRP